MNKKILFLIIFSLILLTTPNVFSADTIEQLPSNDPNLKDLLENPSFDILVVSVLEMNNENATNAKPPRGKLKIDEVIRGRVKPKIINVVLRPPLPKEAEYGGSWYDKSATEEYKASPLRGPEVGKKLIVFTLPWCSYTNSPPANPLDVLDVLDISVYRHDPTINAEIIDFYKFSENGKDIVINNMYTERVGLILVFFFLILILPIVNLILYIFMLKNSSDQIKRRLKKIIFLIPILAIILYVFYEAGVSPYYNIRFDLLLIYPALILNFSFWLILLVQFFRSKNK